MSHSTQELHRSALIFGYEGITLYAAASQLLPLISAVPCLGPTTPSQKPGMVWAIPRSLATTEGVSFDFLSCRYLDVSVPCVGSAFAVTGHDSSRVSPFGHHRVIACLPAHRCLSQAPTSFFASWCQGIRQVLLNA